MTILGLRQSLYLFYLLLKTMIQKRTNGLQLHNRKITLLDRQSEGQRFRYLIDLPEYSAVVENPQALRNMAASQASLLQRIAAENDKLCNSSLFDENKDKIFDTKMVEEMRFSFSNNEPIDIDNKYHSSDIPIKYQQGYIKNRQILADQPLLGGVDLHKKKEAIKEEIMNQSIQTIKNKYIFKQNKTQKQQPSHLAYRREIEFNELDSFSKESHLKSYEAKEPIDSVFNKVLIEHKKKELISAKDEILPLSRKKLSTIKERVEEEQILNTKNSLQKIIGGEGETLNQHYLQVLFDVLDRSKTGKIDRYNCNVQGIRQEFQLIFGIVFYRIKFNSEGFNKKQFVQMAKECLLLLPQAPHALLKQLDPNWHSQKYIHQGSQQLQCQNCRSISKEDEKGLSLYHLLDSPPKEKATDLQQPSVSISKRPYVDLKETRYNNKNGEKIESKQGNTQKEDKYSGRYIKNMHSTGHLAENSKPSTEKYKSQHQKVDEVQLIIRDKQNYAARYVSNHLKEQKQNQKDKQERNNEMKKKKRNISEQILLQHKMNLEQLQKLNQKMEKYIYQQPSIEVNLSREKDTSTSKLI